MLIHLRSLFIVVFATLLAGLSQFATAEWVAADIEGHRCMQNRTGAEIADTVCSQYGGGDTVADPRTGEAMCGKGHCLKDNSAIGKGVVKCSKIINGVAAYDRQGAVVCSGGCEPASKAACEKLTP